MLLNGAYNVVMKDSDPQYQQNLLSRQQRILDLLQRDGHIRVQDLSRALNVSEITIRRDLTYLENRNLLERTHGGAISSRRIQKEINYDNRSDLELENKDSIGKMAASMIEEGDTVFINGGSTTFHVFRYVNCDNVKIVTTNAGAIGQVRHPGVDLVIAGGLYRPQYNTFCGTFTNEIINQVNASKAILGVHGISFRYGLTTPRQDAAETTKLMINRTRGEIIVVADHRKIGLVSDYVTSPVNRITTLITDSFLDDEYRREFEDLGIRVIITNSGNDHNR